jgi:phosphorylcholine metabolism protein LicD
MMPSEYSKENAPLYEFSTARGLKHIKTISKEIIPNYNTWINSGTLLGIYRDGGLIPHDTDVDFGITFHIDEKENVNNFNYKILFDVVNYLL